MNEEQRQRLAELKELRENNSITETELKELDDLLVSEKEAGDQITIGKKEIAEIASKAIEEKTKDLDKKIDEIEKNTKRDPIFSANADQEMKQRSISQIAKIYRGIRKKDNSLLLEAHEEIKKDYELLGINTKDLSEGVEEHGGYLVPVEFYRNVQKLAEEKSIMIKLCKNIPMTSNKMDVPTLESRLTVNMVAEAEAIGASSQTYARPQIEAKKFAAIVIGTSELLEDNATDQEIWNFVADLIAEDFGVKIDDQTINGDGSGNNILGILPHTNTDLNIVTMATGDTDFSDITFEYMHDLIDAVKTSESPKGKFIMNKENFRYLRTLIGNNGQYVYQNPREVLATPDPAIAGFVWGKPVYLSDQFPGKAESAVSTKFVVFGNFERLWIGNRRKLTLKQSTEGVVGSVNLYEEDQEALRATQRLGFQVILGDAISILKTAAS